MGEKRKIALTVNGKRYEKEVEVRVTLADFIRHYLGLTGTHLGCEHGVCGACTILLDGRSARSCLAFAVQADGCQIRTVEGLGTVDGLHAIQEAFWEKHGLQCGYCTPAMLMTAVELVEGNPNPSHDEIQTPFATVIDVAGVARAKRVNFAPPSHQRPSVLPD